MNREEALESIREITLAIREGSHDVFWSVYKAEYNNLVFFVNSYTRNKQDAEDIVQETMLAIWQSHESLDPDKSFRPYLYTIARNKALNYLRDNAKRLKGSSTQEAENIINAISLESSAVMDEINAMELQGFIDRIYASLPDKFAQTFRMSRIEGMTYNEIAQELGITPKAVEYQISISLKAFRSKLKPLEINFK